MQDLRTGDPELGTELMELPDGQQIQIFFPGQFMVPDFFKDFPVPFFWEPVQEGREAPYAVPQDACGSGW